MCQNNNNNNNNDQRIVSQILLRRHLQILIDNSCYAKKVSSLERTIAKKIRAALFNSLFFTRSRSNIGTSRSLTDKKKRMRGAKKFRVHRIVLYITSLLSVSAQSNRAAVVGNCSSLLPGAPRVQSRIHEFLVRTPPLRSFFTYVPSPPPPPSPLLPVPPRRPVSRPLWVHDVCTENISRIEECAENGKEIARRQSGCAIIESARYRGSYAISPPPRRIVISIAYRRNIAKPKLVYRPPD